MKLTPMVLLVCGALLAGCSNLSQPTSPVAQVEQQAVLSWPTIKRGDINSNVTAAQYLLRNAGQTVSVDGTFGAGTETAARNFQAANGLTADGIIGSNTWEKLIRTVRQGDNNDAVRAVQYLLSRVHGYTLTVDGAFGSGTHNAVVNFQGKKGLTADGVVGLYTWNALVGGAGGGGGTDRASLARQILNSSRITLGTSSSTYNGSPRQNIIDTSNGLQATRGCASDANCGLKVYLSATMLSNVLKISNSYTIYISSLAGGIHSSTSYHYRGTGVDIAAINGYTVNGRTSRTDAVENLCRSYGAVEVLGPSNRADHQDHIHCAWSQ